MASKNTLGPQECLIYKGNAVFMLFQCLLDCFLLFGGGQGWEKLHQFYPKLNAGWWLARGEQNNDHRDSNIHQIGWNTNRSLGQSTMNWRCFPGKKHIWNCFFGGASITSKQLYPLKHQIWSWNSHPEDGSIRFFFSVTTQKMPKPQSTTANLWWWLQNYPWEFTIIQASLLGWNTPYKLLRRVSFPPVKHPCILRPFIRASLITLPRKNYPSVRENPYIWHQPPKPSCTNSSKGKIPQNYPATFFPCLR